MVSSSARSDQVRLGSAQVLHQGPCSWLSDVNLFLNDLLSDSLFLIDTGCV